MTSLLGPRRVFLIAALFATVGCGSEPEPVEQASAAVDPPPEKPAEAEQENTPPVIDRIRFEPDPPVQDSRLRAVVDARDVDGDELGFEYSWRIDGRDAGDLAQGRELDLTGIKKGQSIEFVAVAHDGQAESHPYSKRADIDNRPPEILDVDVEPGYEVISGTPVVLYPSGSDPDGDSFDYSYHWTVNGRDLRNDGALLETERLRRGDEIRVRVVADDGEDESEALELPPVVVINGPPRVVSEPPGDLSEGVFRYAVVTEDPDGDPHVEFRLEGAPEGMQIDAYSGLITWAPTPEQAGVHSVKVLAQDLHEGVAEQVFEVRVNAPEPPDSTPADAAP